MTEQEFPPEEFFLNDQFYWALTREEFAEQEHVIGSRPGETRLAHFINHGQELVADYRWQLKRLWESSHHIPQPWQSTHTDDDDYLWPMVAILAAAWHDPSVNRCVDHFLQELRNTWVFVYKQAIEAAQEDRVGRDPERSVASLRSSEVG